MIVTIYNPDGTKLRQPVGYGGGVCHEATRPYERREIPGQTRKFPTEEACQEPAFRQEVEQQQRA
jgi:hypothetical protein